MLSRRSIGATAGVLALALAALSTTIPVTPLPVYARNVVVAPAPRIVKLALLGRNALPASVGVITYGPLMVLGMLNDPLPAVVTAQKGLNEPRYAPLKGIMAATRLMGEFPLAAPSPKGWPDQSE